MAKIYGIGMGPGDPELITVKALNILRDVPVIFYPKPTHTDSFVRQIADYHLKDMPAKQEFAINIPMQPHSDSMDLQQIYQQAVTDIMLHANEQRDIAILCEGDPLLYGSFIYLSEILLTQFKADNLAHQLTIIPGISSILSAASHTQISLAQHSEPLLILPALKIDDALADALASQPNIILMKIGKRFGALRDLLQTLDLLDCASYIEYASLPQQKMMPLRHREATEAPYFSMVLIHKNQPAMDINNE